MSERVLVAGLGNVLMRDDGIGPYCVEYLLARYVFSPDTSVLDLGTPGLDLALHLSSADIVIAVDAVRGVPPGTIHVVERPSLEQTRIGLRLDTHAPGLVEAVAIAQLVAGRPRDVVLVGLGGHSFDHGARLSRRVRLCIGALADRVLIELSRRGSSWERRDRAVPDRIWWEERRGRAAARFRGRGTSRRRGSIAV